jgi:two-component system KDP operon response regulator KdpE
VLDDEPQVLRYVQRTLDAAGFRPIVTQDPEEALRLAEVEDPDLVLLDMNLPGTDGFELLRRLREFSGVPVVFLTAQNDSDLAAKALRAGADDYITKPFAPTELAARIEASLRRRVMSDQTEVRPRTRSVVSWWTSRTGA